MQEFKFRVFSHSTKKFLKVDDRLYKNSNKFYCGLEFFGGDDIRIEYYWNDNGDKIFVENANESKFAINQYTGLKDCKGVEIYEGDIVSVKTEDPDVCYVGYIDFNCGAFYFNSKKKFFDGEHYTDETIISNINYKCEVIGNIYENEELLKQKE